MPSIQLQNAISLFATFTTTAPAAPTTANMSDYEFVLLFISLKSQGFRYSDGLLCRHHLTEAFFGGERVVHRVLAQEKMAASLQHTAESNDTVKLE